MILVYFRTAKGLVRLPVETNNVRLAQIEAYWTACEALLKPSSPVLAVIEGGRS